MNKMTLQKAIELDNDVENIMTVINEAEKQRHWISVITPHHKDCCFSSRFQDELKDWLKQKACEYLKELEEL